MNHQHWATRTARLGLVAVLLVVGCGAGPPELVVTRDSSLETPKVVTRLDRQAGAFCPSRAILRERVQRATSHPGGLGRYGSRSILDIRPCTGK